MLIDVKHAVRALRRGAGASSVSVLALALGIAATATMLSVFDAIDFRPLPFRQADALVDVSEVDATRPDISSPVSPGVYLDWRERARSVAPLAAASSIVASLQDGDGGLDASRVSDNFFSTLGVRPAVGRVFDAEDFRQKARVAVISHDVWRSRFGGDPEILGRTVPLSWAGEYRSVAAEPYTVVGVLPRGVRYPSGSQVWIPAPEGFGDSRRDSYLTVVGRLQPGVPVEAARAEFEILSAQLAADFPQDYERRVARVSPLRVAMRAAVEGRGAAARLPLLGVAAFVLFLAALNVTGLFLARTAAQVRDMKVRLSLGAPRSRLAMLLLTQSLILALVAGVAGIAISHGLIRLVSSRLQVAESGMALMLDQRFLVFALLLALATGLGVALLPMWRLARLESRGVLGAESVRGAGIARTGAAQRGLVVGQIALAVMLLSGAGLLSAEFLRLVTNETGFDPEGLLVASLPISRAPTPEEAIAQARQVEERIGQLGGISSAALGGLPAEGYAYRLENGDVLREGHYPMSYRVSPGYFGTLGVRLDAGREFGPADREGAAPVAIVNRLAAELWWPGRDPVGQRVYMLGQDGSGAWTRVVGVVDNERVVRSMTWELRPVLYRPFDQLTHERRRVQAFVRAEGRPEAALSAVDRAIEEARGGGGWRGERVVTMKSLLGDTLAEQRFRAWALSVFSIVALFLATLGIYGVVATMVAQRKAEIGVRIALGARPAQVLGLVSRQGIVLAVVGFVLGLAGSVATARILQSLLVDATGFDVWMPLLAGTVLAGAVLVACYFPARRAARIDPTPLLHDA